MTFIVLKRYVIFSEYLLEKNLLITETVARALESDGRVKVTKMAGTTWI